MGDTKSHEDVFNSAIKPMLNRVLPGRDRDSIFFELGNFLTDVSQFRDPLASFSAKSTIYKMQIEELKKPWYSLPYKPLIKPTVNWPVSLDNYLDDLMGKESQPWGYLAQWFEQIVFVIVVEKFKKEGIPPEELKEIFFPNERDQWYFSQYFPHEHLDFPPWPLGDALGDRRKSSITDAQGRPRKILKYLDEFQVIFISDLLTTIEKEWSTLVSKGNLTQNQKRIHSILMRFGHACHVIEDFYFHSNFVDLAWLKISHEKYPELNNERDFWVWFHENAFKNYRERRTFFRRIRSPLLSESNKKNELSNSASDASKEVFTGGFGDKDIYHTFYDLISGLSSNVKNMLGVFRLIGYPFWLLEYIVYEERREELRRGGDSKVKEIIGKHRQQLEKREIGIAATGAARMNKLHPLSAEAINKACDLDKKFGDSYNWVGNWGIVNVGVGGFLLNMSKMVQQEHYESEMRSREFDRGRLVFDVRSFNGATSETIGSHSLLAKDSIRKQPLRDEAMTLARYVSAYFVKLMLRQVYNNPEKRRVDWLHVLRHFICHPDQAENQWYKKVILGERAKDECKLKYFNPNEPTGRDRAIIATRTKQETKMLLELAYFRMEREAEARWIKDKTIIKS